MVRILGPIVGLGFVGVLLWSLMWGAIAFVQEPPKATAEHEFHKHPEKVDFSFNGPLGKFDQAQLQRGLQVYKEVCSACHSLRLVSFRDLTALGYTDGQAKTLAAEWSTETPSINPETGEPATRKSIASDRIPSPFPNEVAARAANNGALPPDLSLITKARHDGSNYVHALLTGYSAQPAALLKHFPEAKTGEGLHYNPYFANLNLAMAPPLTAEGQVSYADGTKPTVDQMAKDVSAFLTWTAEPKLQNRHRTGLAVLIFLVIFTGLTWMAYQNVWRDKKH
ncbi:cytochrome c1 [Sphingobium boeckii]|uniref:Cytochrome c1 n=1 Tax=Sphingobium boeckii TaxID=1082345 RepID=A0A7W9EF88_9SPHN|nr:cytochrome c1 [Sphingobium boeckii]MBB5687048.1 ubiquinol-cytochrome c reductase cytochrome c1 subunit [Sphingobium boeckii]